MLLRIAYGGLPFHGSARQPDQRTVEGELLDAISARFSAEQVSDLRFASRTDAGVSALGNVVQIQSSIPRRSLAKALNRTLHDIWVNGTAEAPEGLNPRHARSRTYSYYLPPLEQEERWKIKRLAPAFEGEFDMTAFHRFEEGRDPVRRIDRVELRSTRHGPVLRVTAPSFLWQQVRRMTGAMVAHARGEIEAQLIIDALHGGDYRPKPAPPEPLILEEVAYDGVIFDKVEPDHDDQRFSAFYHDAIVRMRITGSLLAGETD